MRAYAALVLDVSVHPHHAQMGGCPVPNIPASAILESHLRRELTCHAQRDS